VLGDLVELVGKTTTRSFPTQARETVTQRLRHGFGFRFSGKLCQRLGKLLGFLVPNVQGS